MNKKIKFLVALLTGVVMSAGFAACGTNPEEGVHEHTYSETYTSAGAEGHYHQATCEHTDEHTAIEPHNFGTDNVCDDCGYVHEHTYSEAYTSAGAEGHYHQATCEHTDEHTAIEPHNFGTDNECDDCGYVHEHTYSEAYTSAGAEGHYHQATCEHTDEHTAIEPHNFGTDNECDDCGYAKVYKEYVSYDSEKANEKSGFYTRNTSNTWNVDNESVSLTEKGLQSMSVQMVSSNAYSNISNIEFDITFDAESSLTWAGFGFSNTVPEDIYAATSSFGRRFNLLGSPDGNVKIEKGVTYHVKYQHFLSDGYTGIVITNKTTGSAMESYVEATDLGKGACYLYFFNEAFGTETQEDLAKAKNGGYTVENFTITSAAGVNNGIAPQFEYVSGEVNITGVTCTLNIGSAPAQETITAQTLTVPGSMLANESIQIISKQKFNNISSIEFDITIDEGFACTWGGLGFLTTTEGKDIYSEMGASPFMAQLVKGKTYHASYIFAHADKYIQANFTCDGETPIKIENYKLASKDGCYYIDFYQEYKSNSAGGYKVANFKIVADGVTYTDMGEIFSYGAAVLDTQKETVADAGYTHAELVESNAIDSYLVSGGYANINTTVDGKSFENGVISYKLTDKEFAVVLGEKDGVATYLLIKEGAIDLYIGSQKVNGITVATEGEITVTLKFSVEGILSLTVGEQTTDLGNVGTVTNVKVQGLGGLGSVEFSAISFGAWEDAAQ